MILIWLLILIILLIIVFIFLRVKTGLRFEQISYLDSDSHGQTLYSPNYGICGKPDYIIRQNNSLIPVELKPLSGRVNDSQIAQVLTYCLLIEDKFKVKVPYGLIRNKNGDHKISFSNKSRDYIKEVTNLVRRSYDLNLDRSHDNLLVCQYCRFNDICDQALTR